MLPHLQAPILRFVIQVYFLSYRNIVVSFISVGSYSDRISLVRSVSLSLRSASCFWNFTQVYYSYLDFLETWLDGHFINPRRFTIKRYHRDMLMKFSAGLSNKHDNFYVTQGFGVYVAFLETWRDGNYFVCQGPFNAIDYLTLPPMSVDEIFVCPVQRAW